MANPIYYLHIPKTGGTSLISYLDAQFPADIVCPAQLLPELFALEAGSFSRYALYRGHLWHGLERHVGGSLRYLTMLRDPVQRTLSWFCHVRRDPYAYRHDRVIEEDWSLLRFVTDPQTNWDLVNAQTLFLAIDMDFERLRRDHAGYGRETIRSYAARRSDRRLLDLAKRRVESMVAFGITERMQDSIHLFVHTLGLDPGLLPERLNVSADHVSMQELTPEVLRAIEAHTELDRELYAWAGELFSERFGEMVRKLVLSEAARSGSAGRIWRTPLAPDALNRIAMRVLTCPTSVGANSTFEVVVEVANESGESLSSQPPNPVDVSYHWLPIDSGGQLQFDGIRTSLPMVLQSGSSMHVVARVIAPEVLGTYRLQMRVVQEGVSWIEHADPGDDPEVVVQAA